MQEAEHSRTEMKDQRQRSVCTHTCVTWWVGREGRTAWEALTQNSPWDAWKFGTFCLSFFCLPSYLCSGLLIPSLSFGLCSEATSSLKTRWGRALCNLLLSGLPQPLLCVWPFGPCVSKSYIWWTMGSCRLEARWVSLVSVTSSEM